MPKKKFYITTSIAYANAQPHLGYALETVQADVLARYHHILGDDVFFLTGTDEHGRKVVEAAERARKTPEDFTDEISKKFKELAKALNLSNNDFIRTTDKKRHWPVVQKIWLKLKENGDIYKKQYEGLYCSGCEAFITQKDLINGKCAIHQKEPEVIKEENYFFQLSKYSKSIKDILAEDKIEMIPASRKNEMLSFASEGLQDISFSRPSKDLKWGIPVPDDKTQTIYVWADALINYLSGGGEHWPADVQCIGKDIQKFHCLIWPAMILSLGLPLPKTIFVHGFITVAGQKMSKSLGNVVDPLELIKKYGADPVRYFLLREIPPTEDGDYTEEKFVKRYNADLASGLGNLVARVITLASRFKNIDSRATIKNKFIIDDAVKLSGKNLDEFKFNEALMAIWELIGWSDKYIEIKRPWEESENQLPVISDLLYALSIIAKALQPFLPETSEKILKQIKIKKSQPLFPRIDTN